MYIVQIRPGVHKLYRVAFCTPFYDLSPWWRRKWQPTPIFLLGEFHGQRSPWGHKESDTNEQLTYLLGTFWVLGLFLWSSGQKAGALLTLLCHVPPLTVPTSTCCIKWRENNKSSSGSLHTLETSLLGKEESFPSVLSVFGLSHVGNFRRKGRKYIGDFLPTLSKH